MSLLGGVLQLIQGNKAAGSVALANNDALRGVVTGQEQSEKDLAAAGAGAKDQINTATGSANDTIGTGYNKQVTALQPYMDAGGVGLQGLLDRAKANPQFSWDPNTNMSDPAFQFRQKQGEESISAQNSLHGLLGSGNFAKDISSFTTGNAAQYENDDFNRALQQFKTNMDATTQTYLPLANFGADATKTFNADTGQAFGDQARNTQAAGYAGADVDTSIAKFLASLRAGAATTAGNFRVGQGNATAAKDLNTGNSWASIGGEIPGLLQSLSQMMAGGKGGG